MSVSISLLTEALPFLPAKGKGAALRARFEAHLADLQAAEVRKTDFAARGRLAWETMRRRKAEADAAAAAAAAKPAKAPKAPKARNGKARH